MARDEGIEPPTVPQDCGKDRHVHVYFVQATELDFFPIQKNKLYSLPSNGEGWGDWTPDCGSEDRHVTTTPIPHKKVISI